MLMHAIVHGGCTDTVRESALAVDSERKSLATPGTRAHNSIALGFLVGRSTKDYKYKDLHL